MNEKMKPIKRVAIYGSRSQEGYLDLLLDFIDSLAGNGITVTVERKLAKTLQDAGFKLNLHGASTCVELPEETDAVISAGGDGTFLRSARWIGTREVPIIGINTGHLGFLAENSIEDLHDLPRRLANGEGRLEERFVLEVDADGMPENVSRYALNDVAFLKGDTSSMINVGIRIDDNFLSDYRADGLIVATPTGSTAYNLSVGGPIIVPTLKCMVLSPVAPHTLTLRPLVAGEDSIIVATVSSRASTYRLSIDGHSFSMPCGGEVRIKKAAHSVRVIRMPEENFASTMRQKLLWGVEQSGTTGAETSPMAGSQT